MNTIKKIKNFCLVHIKNRMVAYDNWFDGLLNDNGTSEKNKLTRTLGHILLASASVAIILLIINLCLHSSFFGETGSFNAGTFGDFFGGVLNPILTFFTLFGLITTIVIQRQELKLARTEYEKTATALSTQAVELTFFNLLDLHHKISNSTKVNMESLCLDSDAEELEFILEEIPEIKKTYEGRDSFEAILNYIALDNIVLEKYKNYHIPSMVDERYSEFHHTRNHILGHYFRNLYQILKTIDSYDESIVNEKNKQKYADILRAQLSIIELVLLFYNCLNNMSGYGKFKNLLIKYAMFEYLTVDPSKDKNEFIIGDKYLVSKSMILQYKNITPIIEKNNHECFGGAFGKSRSVPADFA